MNESYERIYKGMNNGTYDNTYYSLESGRNEIGISVKKIKKASKEAGINFDEFLKWAQEKKAEENNK